MDERVPPTELRPGLGTGPITYTRGGIPLRMAARAGHHSGAATQSIDYPGLRIIGLPRLPKRIAQRRSAYPQSANRCV